MYKLRPGRAGKYKFGARAGKYKFGARAVKYKLGARARAGGQSKGRGPGNTNTPSLQLLIGHYLGQKIHSIKVIRDSLT